MYGLFNNKYSGIITKGLGLPACSGMITMFFSVFTLEISPPPPPAGGGGGPVAVSPDLLYTPIKFKVPTETRLITVTVKLGKEHTWRKVYEVALDKAQILVNVIDFVNVVKQKTNIAFANLKHISKKVIATFTDKYNDKQE